MLLCIQSRGKSVLALLVGIDRFDPQGRIWTCQFWEENNPFWILVTVSTNPEFVNKNRSNEQYGGGRDSTERKIHHKEIVVNFKFILK